MSKKYIFGTDGIRGEVNRYPILPEFILKLGMVIGLEIKKSCSKKRCSVVIGKDTRVSCDMMESVLIAAFSAVGVDVFLVGILPTSAISVLTKYMKADLGIMLSASHNPYDHNGLKIFDRLGFKIARDFEELIERGLSRNLTDDLVISKDLGKVYHSEDSFVYYVNLIKKSVLLISNNLNLKIVVDCSNGSACNLVYEIFGGLGFELIVINNVPNGININENCGSSFPDHAVEVVKSIGADIGFVFDGDADRLVVIDEKGNVVDGDQLIAVIAKNWLMKDKLSSKVVVSSYVSSSSLREYLANLGLELCLSPVGDRNVIEVMKEYNCNLGGEKSGHVILSDYVSTGDGFVTALQILSILIEEQKLASEVLYEFLPMPQVNYNIGYDVEVDSKYIENVVQEVRNKFPYCYRIIIRKSGTEKLIRIMIEGHDLSSIKEVIEFIDFKFKNI